MKSLSKEDDVKFTRAFRRDAKLILFIFFLSGLLFFVLPLIGYLGRKYGF